MSLDVERVARLLARHDALRRGIQPGRHLEYVVQDTWQDYINDAQDAMRETLLIAAEALRNIPADGPEQLPCMFSQHEAADWLKGRADAE